jgi:glycosyltransferase involved in cell wall biosynthesis
MIRFSVVTIVRNDPEGVLRTLRSVFAQTYRDYESIVQDGASTDGTSEILRSMEPFIDSLVIEPDRGIYDAMNRALARATGDYLLFLNADDFFVAADVLARAAEMIDPETDDIVSGHVIRDEDGKRHGYRPDSQYWAGSTADHQATFIRREVMQELRYDEAHKVCADLHFFARARKAGYGFRRFDLTVARKPFAVGASSNFVTRHRDRLEMLEGMFGDEHPVRDLLDRELRFHVSKTLDLDRALLDGRSIEEVGAIYDTITQGGIS